MSFIELNGNLANTIWYSVIAQAQISAVLPLYFSPAHASGLKKQSEPALFCKKSSSLAPNS